MRQFTKRLVRSKSKRIGNQFEEEIKNLLENEGLTVQRIPDGAKRVSGGKIIAIKSPFDFFAFKPGIAFFFDAKVREGSRINYSSINQKQVEALLRIYNNGFKAGFIIKFDDKKTTKSQIYFASADKLKSVKRKESLSKNEMIHLGDIFSISIDELFK